MAYSPSNARHSDNGRSVNTTDATATTIKTIPIQNLTAIRVVAPLVAVRTGGTSGTVGDVASYLVSFTAKAVSGTCFVSPIKILDSYEDQAAWDVTLSTTNNAVNIQVTGAANNNITWNLGLMQVCENFAAA